MPEAELQPPGPVTLTQIEASIKSLEAAIIPRLDAHEGALSQHGEQIARVEAKIESLGLNGLTPYVKPFFEQYAASLSRRQSYITVRQDIALKFRWLASPRAWLRAIFYAALGAIGVQLATGNFHLPF